MPSNGVAEVTRLWTERPISASIACGRKIAAGRLSMTVDKLSLQGHFRVTSESNRSQFAVNAGLIACRLTVGGIRRVSILTPAVGDWQVDIAILKVFVCP